MQQPPAKVKIPLGLRNNNPGNIRYNPRTKWNGQIGSDEKGFCQFESLTLGVRAAAKVLITGFRKQGEDTIREIIEAWAPASENATEAYIIAIEKLTGIDDMEQLTCDAETLFALLRGMFRIELGGWFVSDDVIRAGVSMALEKVK